MEKDMIIKQASRLDPIKEYYFSKKLKAIAKLKSEGKEIINLGIGNPDLPPRTEAISELQKAASLDTTHGYQSYRGIPELRKSIVKWYSKYYEVKADAGNEVLPLIGSKEGIMHIAMSFLEKGDAVLVPNPGYPSYRSASMLAGATVIDYQLKEENNWLPDLEEIEKEDLTKVKIIWVNYPNMPTGKAATLSFFEQLISFGKKHQILIVNDNPYSFILRAKPLSILSVKDAMDVAIELNSLSKSHNMAGWRIGMMLGNSEMIATVLKFKSNMDSGMFLPLQLGAVEALNNPRSWYDDLNVVYKKRQKLVFQLLEMLNCEFDKNQGGLFVWAKIPKIYKDGYEFSDTILDGTEVFITPGGIFGSQGKKYIRISICNKKVVFERCMERIQKWKNKNASNFIPTINIEK